ncbi:MAG: glutamine synthetase [Myxococcales bacterium]|nr:glutamine synthetase [Myxococcales bacterium]
MSAEMTPESILNEFEERGVKRIKLGVTDIDGILRGKYLTMDKARSVLKGGAGFCDCTFGWDSADNLYDNCSFSNWDKGFPDAAYHLAPESMRWLPDEPGTPFFLAELKADAGNDFHTICPRNVLKRVLARAEKMGFGVNLAYEYEFFIFDETPHSIREKNYRNLNNFTPGMFGYSILRNSVDSDLYHELLDYCEAMGMDLEGLHTETGPGVWEACIKHMPALEACDRAVLFKTFSKVFFQKRNLLATFMAKWTLDYPGQSGHLHQSLWDLSDGKSVLYDQGGQGCMSETMKHFVGGQLYGMRELSAMIAPTVNSYKRMVKGAWAPTAARWGIDNRTVALRVIQGSEKSQRVEHRLSAADGNPYLVAAAAIASGLHGIENKIKPNDPVVGNGYDGQDELPEEVQLPATLREASELFVKSEIAKEYLGSDFVNHFSASRDWESREYERAVTDWELQRYLEII